MMKICLMCGKNFDVIHVRPNVQASNLMHQKYCSERCGIKAGIQRVNKVRSQRRKMELEKSSHRTCARCGKEFIATCKPQKYCSPQCRNVQIAVTYARKHPEKVRLVTLVSHIRLRKRVLEKFGGKCIRCGIDDWRVLQLNHLNGGGTKEHKAKSRDRFYREILTGKRDEDFNILCANCNILYEYDRGKRYRGYQEIAHKI